MCRGQGTSKFRRIRGDPQIYHSKKRTRTTRLHQLYNWSVSSQVFQDRIDERRSSAARHYPSLRALRGRVRHDVRDALRSLQLGTADFGSCARPPPSSAAQGHIGDNCMGGMDRLFKVPSSVFREQADWCRISSGFRPQKSNQAKQRVAAASCYRDRGRIGLADETWQRPFQPFPGQLALSAWTYSGSPVSIRALFASGRMGWLRHCNYERSLRAGSEPSPANSLDLHLAAHVSRAATGRTEGFHL